MDEAKAPKTGSLLAAGLTLGALANLLLFRQDLGLGWTLFLLALPAAFVALLRVNAVRTTWASFGPLLGAYVFFSVMLTVRASEFVTFLNVGACVILLALMARFALPGCLSDLRLGELFITPFALLGESLHRAAPVAFEMKKTLESTEKRHSARPLMRGLLLSSLVLLIFVPLLASADAVFANYLKDLSRWLQPERWQEQAERVLLVLATAWLAIGGLTHALTSRRDLSLPRLIEGLPLGYIEAMTVFSSVALVFGAFLSIQLKYLFGGAARVLAVPGLTYADYARRGFAELVTVAVLTLALVIGLNRVTRRVETQRNVFPALTTLIVGETLVLLASAWNRMAAYEAAYGATQTRLHVDAFILWLGIALLWLVFTLWSRIWSARFAIGGLACALGFAASLDLINPDAPGGASQRPTLASDGQAGREVPRSALGRCERGTVVAQSETADRRVAHCVGAGADTAEKHSKGLAKLAFCKVDRISEPGD